MTLFLARSRFARVTSVLGPHYRYSSGLFSTTPEMKIPTFGDPYKYFARVTSVLGPHYRYSSGLFSTTPERKIPTFGDPNKYLNRTEERNEKHRKVQQLAEDVVILSCESTANGGVCDIYVVSPESCREAQAIMSYLKPQVLFLQLSENKSSIAILDQLTEFEKYNATDLVKAVMNKPMVTFRALITWSFQKYMSKIEASLYYVAYREAKNYGSKVVFGDRPTEITRKRYWRKRACNKLVRLQLLSKACLFFMLKVILSILTFVSIVWLKLSIDICREVMIDERDKYMAHRLLKVARNNSSVVAIVGELHLEGIKTYWEQPIEVEDLMTIPLRRPTLYNSFLSWALKP